MQYIYHNQLPIGEIFLAADEISLTGLWFEGQKYYARYLDKGYAAVFHTEEREQAFGASCQNYTGRRRAVKRSKDKKHYRS